MEASVDCSQKIYVVMPIISQQKFASQFNLIRDRSCGKSTAAKFNGNVFTEMFIFVIDDEGGNRKIAR